MLLKIPFLILSEYCCTFFICEGRTTTPEKAFVSKPKRGSFKVTPFLPGTALPYSSVTNSVNSVLVLVSSALLQ